MCNNKYNNKLLLNVLLFSRNISPWLHLSVVKHFLRKVLALKIYHWMTITWWFWRSLFSNKIKIRLLRHISFSFILIFLSPYFDFFKRIVGSEHKRLSLHRDLVYVVGTIQKLEKLSSKIRKHHWKLLIWVFLVKLK